MSPGSIQEMLRKDILEAVAVRTCVAGITLCISLPMMRHEGGGSLCWTRERVALSPRGRHTARSARQVGECKFLFARHLSD